MLVDKKISIITVNGAEHEVEMSVDELMTTIAENP